MVAGEPYFGVWRQNGIRSFHTMLSQLILTEALYQRTFDTNGLSIELASQFVCNSIFVEAVPFHFFCDGSGFSICSWQRVTFYVRTPRFHSL